MEILLWLWFYDKNLFFNINTTIQFFKNSWILPIIIHSFIVICSIYYLCLKAKICNVSYNFWMCFYFIFSCFNIAFLILIRSICDKEIKKEENNNNTDPEQQKKNKIIIERKVKRNALTSSIGILILYIGIIHFIFNIFSMIFYHKAEKEECNKILKTMLIYYGLFNISINLPILIGIIVLIIKKGFAYFRNINSDNEKLI